MLLLMLLYASRLNKMAKKRPLPKKGPRLASI